MSFIAKFDVCENAKELYETVIPEKEGMKTKRATVDVDLKDDVCTFSVKANDFTAFRAMSNAVMRLITIYNKSIEV